MFYVAQVLHMLSGICVRFLTTGSKSNQISFISIAQNHNHIASVGFTICTVSDILDSSEEKLAILRSKNLLTAKRRWMKSQGEPQRRDPSPRMGRHAIDVACMEQNNKIKVYKLH